MKEKPAQLAEQQNLFVYSCRILPMPFYNLIIYLVFTTLVLGTATAVDFDQCFSVYVFGPF